MTNWYDATLKYLDDRVASFWEAFEQATAERQGHVDAKMFDYPMRDYGKAKTAEAYRFGFSMGLTCQHMDENGVRHAGELSSGGRGADTDPARASDEAYHAKGEGK